MAKHDKKEIICIAYLDGKITNQEAQNRVIYSRRDGTRYVIVMGNKKDVHIGKDGGLYYKVHARTLQEFSHINTSMGHFLKRRKND